jgi:hypothetical protein
MFVSMTSMARSWNGMASHQLTVIAQKVAEPVQ